MRALCVSQSRFNLSNFKVLSTGLASQHWEPGQVYSKGKLNYRNERYVIGTTNPVFSKDKDNLHHLLKQQVNHAPCVGIRLWGHHFSEHMRSILLGFDTGSAGLTRTRRDNKIHTAVKTNFNLVVDTSELYICSRPTCETWPDVSISLPYMEAYRGGLLRRAAETHIETATDIKSWCHTYITQVSRSMLPHVFVLRRALAQNRASQHLGQSLERMICETNYVGTIDSCTMYEDYQFAFYS